MHNGLKFFVLILCLALPSAPAPAAESGGGLTVQFNIENDSPYETDYHYTNGFQLRFITPGLNEFALGQHMYTPEYKLSPFLQEDDRPYAAYLYGALASHWQRERRQDTLELAFGAVGPCALGEQVQNGVHKVLDTNKSEGWEHQLENEPMLMLSLATVWRLNVASGGDGGLGLDFLPRLSASLGTPYTRAGAGFELRLGWNLPADFASSHMLPGSGVHVADAEADIGIYIFGGVEAQAVAWNTFLDGNIWRDSHSVDKYPLVADVTGGIAVICYDFRLSYTHVYRSKEFHGRKSWQNFGSLMVAYVF